MDATTKMNHASQESFLAALKKLPDPLRAALSQSEVDVQVSSEPSRCSQRVDGSAR